MGLGCPRLLLGCLAPTAAADVAKPAASEPKSFDKQVVDALRDVHNKGADLYNTTKDYAAAFRMYEGALRTVRPLLPARPSAQKLIDEGLAAADKETDAARQAFLLHETIEKVRSHLKQYATAPAAAPVPSPKPVPKPVESVATPAPKVKAAAPKESVKPQVQAAAPKVESKPVDPAASPVPKAKAPAPKKPDASPVREATVGVSGTVTLDGKPVAKAGVVLISLALAEPRVFTAVAKEDGTFAVADAVPPGKYVAVVTGKDVPAQYAASTTSGVVVDVKAGGGTVAIALK